MPIVRQTVTNLEDLKEPTRLPPELRKEFSKNQRLGDRYTKGIVANNQKKKYKTFDKTIKKYQTLKDRLKQISRRWLH